MCPILQVKLVEAEEHFTAELRLAEVHSRSQILNLGHARQITVAAWCLVCGSCRAIKQFVHRGLLLGSGRLVGNPDTGSELKTPCMFRSVRTHQSPLRGAHLCGQKIVDFRSLGSPTFMRDF